MTPPMRISKNTMLEQNTLGRTVSTRRPQAWRHPWFTEAMWMPKKKAWVAFVLAGFVNGMAPMVRTTAGELREARGTFFGQLVDARTGAAEIKQLAQLAISNGDDDSGLPDGTAVDVPLYQNPPVGLNQWRNIGWDGDSNVPLFFQDRGVNKPPRSAAAQLEATGTVALAEPPKGNRLLRACDIILHQPRTALTSQITIDGSGAVTGMGLVNQTLGVREAAANDILQIQTGTYRELQQASLNFSGASNVIASDYEEKTWDEILISTVYLMSPPDAPLDSKPDATWQAFAKHATPEEGGQGFWNMLWAQPRLNPFFNTDIFRPALGTLSVLGGGAGFMWASSVASSINDATQGALNILQSQSLAGSFWTPTGCGTTSAYPATTTTPAKPGIDKAENAAAKAKAAAAKFTRQLDPRFPFEGQKFNRSLI